MEPHEADSAFPARTPAAAHGARYAQVRCPSCGYSLEGHADPSRCPECGEDFSHLPGGVAWFAGERLRMVGFGALLLAVSLFILSASRSEGFGAELGRDMSSEIGLFSRLAGAGVSTKVSYLGVFLGGVLLWTASPKPRDAALSAALAACLLAPTLTIAADLYADALINELSGGQFRGISNGAIDFTLYTLAAADAAIWPVALTLFLLLIARHLSLIGLESLADRLTPWARPLFFVLPTLVVVDRVLTYMLVSTTAGRVPIGGMGAGRGAFAGGGSIAGQGFDSLVLLLGPLHRGLSILVSLVVAFAAVRLWLRVRWTLEAARK